MKQWISLTMYVFFAMLVGAAAVTAQEREDETQDVIYEVTVNGEEGAEGEQVLVEQLHHLTDELKRQAAELELERDDAGVEVRLLERTLRKAKMSLDSARTVLENMDIDVLETQDFTRISYVSPDDDEGKARYCIKIIKTDGAEGFDDCQVAKNVMILQDCEDAEASVMVFRQNVREKANTNVMALSNPLEASRTAIVCGGEEGKGDERVMVVSRTVVNEEGEGVSVKGSTNAQVIIIKGCGELSRELPEAVAEDVELEAEIMVGEEFQAKPVERNFAAGYLLADAIPNPLTNQSRIMFTLPEGGKTTLGVYNEVGELVTVLVDEDLPVGEHAAVFDASEVAPGVYLYRLESGRFTETKRMSVLK